MNERESAGQAMVKGVGRMTVHLIAVVVGVILMIAGLGMGVTVVLLPLGVPIGLGGLLLFLWGLFEWGTAGRAQPPKP